MAKMPQVLEIDPPNEITFKGPFTEVVTTKLRLTNPSEKKVCFKVKTTAPKQYCVRPNSGFIPVKGNVEVLVVLQPMDVTSEGIGKHTFMVQTTYASDGDTSLENIWKNTAPNELMDSKLRVVFDDSEQFLLQPTMNIKIEDALESTYLSSTFRFTVHNIPVLRKLFLPGKSIDSDVIKDISQFMNAEVLVKFWPCGRGPIKTDPNYCSLFLCCIPKNMKECLYFKYRFDIVDRNKDDWQGVLQGGRTISQDSLRGWGYNQFIRLQDDDDKIRESLTVEVDIQIFTERSYLRWLKLCPQKKKTISSDVMCQTAVDFVNQVYNDGANKVNVDDEATKLVRVSKVSKLINVSKQMVCTVFNVLKTRVTGQKRDDGKINKLSTHEQELVNRFIKSIRTGVWKYDRWEDLLYMLKIANASQVMWMKNEACKLIANGLTMENGIECLICADLSDAKELRKKCLEFCAKNCQDLKLTDECLVYRPCVMPRYDVGY